MNQGSEDSLQKLRDDVDRRSAQHEERQKARDPNIISAIRTLVDDITAYVRGERKDFPREALVGVFGAYLRPRLVLIFGSIIATIIAAGEFWLKSAPPDLWLTAWAEMPFFSSSIRGMPT